MKLSIIIPSVNDPYLQSTVDDIRANAKTDPEIIVVFDGVKGKVAGAKAIYISERMGMRNAINVGVANSKSDYIIKTDEHCMFGENFDVKLIRDYSDDHWVMIPRRYKLDVEKCYFSPRSSQERVRIAKLVKKNESVLVIGSGVGIYPIIISKHSKAKEIYAIEINQKAVEFAAENLKLNKINNVELYLGDARDVLPKIRKTFDRIILPLPSNADSFLDLILKKIEPKGIIHMYDFESENDIPHKSIEKIKQYLKKPKILNVQKVGQYSPRKFRVCVDFKIN